jgi:hypothetical protein
MASQYTGATITVILVGIVTQTAASGRLISVYTAGATGDSTNVGSMCLLNATATQIQPTRNGVHVTQTIASMAAGLAGVYSLRCDGTNVVSRLGGADSGNNAQSGAFAIDKFSFGVGLVSSAVGDFCTTTDVCEWAIVDHALGSTEWAAWSTYTQARYGLAA